MRGPKYFSGSLLFLCLFNICFSQSNRQLLYLRDWVKTNKPVGYDSTLNYLNYNIGNNLHYFFPLQQLYRDEKKFREILSDSGYNDALSQAVSITGDYSSALDYQRLNYKAEVDEVSRRQIYKVIQGMKDIKNVDAEKFISFIARNYQVIMMNESPNKPLHRVFMMSLLDDLYKRGFRYLAMEMLNNNSNHSLDKLTSTTGNYSAEPVAGEMIRYALDLGYSLISYEDTLAYKHRATERDSIQAVNIYRTIRMDSSAKIIVYASYGHIAEKGDGNYIPMGMAFKKISGIDPLTIDQVSMTEESDFAFGKFFYNAYLEKFPLTSSSIALINDQPINVTQSELYDLTVIHPPTTYRDARPTWLSLNGRRQPTYIKPSNKNTFFVQAYYQFESFSNKPGQLIPADQTYIPTSKGNYLLYLRRGKYIVIFRDVQYKALNTLHIEVN
ncbi:MAG: hypothetical protein JST75_17825 [Bacteroidetes bacterium]|nr:hypothetical protein [Bacteroidota bacterium]